MVALKGKGWTLAPSAERAVEEADEIAPHRSRASDGSIGDAAHAARDSFHNPYGGFVDAVDITHDPAGGFDAHHHADHVVASQPDHLDHIISNRRIASAAKGWVWRPYTGSNPHDKHIHIANKRSTAGRNWSGRLFDHQEDWMGDPYKREEVVGPLDKINYATGLELASLGRIEQALSKLTGDQVDEQQIADLVIAGLDPDRIAAAVVKALPKDQAKQVADLLAKRLQD